MAAVRSSPVPFSEPPALLADQDGLAALLERLRAEPLLAVDTEAASFHRYHDRVYLLQVSTRTHTWLIDPLGVAGLPGLGDVLLDPAIEIVFHDADYDLRLLHHEFGIRAARLFDTRIAAQFLNEPGIGLATLLEKYFGVKLDKRYQRADWSLRPLSPPMLAYAAEDTRWLPELRDLFRSRLADMGRLAWVEEEFELLTRVQWAAPATPEEAALGVKGARALKPRALAVFRELYVWRDRTAAALDRAAFRVLGNEALFLLAERTPRTLAQLAAVPGVGKETVSRRGDEVLAAIARGLAVPEDQLPRYTRGPRYRPDPAFDARVERLKAMRATAAERLNLQPGVLAPNWLLEAVARAVPGTREDLARVEGLRRWQVEAIGEELLEAVRQ